MTDRTAAIEAPQHGEHSQLLSELARRDEEILRLRDLLIVRDAELGAARGKLAMVEQGSQRIAEAAARIPIPGATRLIHAMIRSLQRSLQ